MHGVDLQEGRGVFQSGDRAAAGYSWQAWWSMSSRSSRFWFPFLWVHGDLCRLVVGVEVGLEVSSELTVPRALACCARRQGALAGSTAQGAAGNVRGLWDALRAWRHHAVPPARSA